MLKIPALPTRQALPDDAEDGIIDYFNKLTGPLI